jgi:hypothetical protein
VKPFELIFISLFQLLLLIDELARPSSSLFKHLIDSSISHFLMLLHSDFFKPRESGKRSSEAVTSVTLPLKRILLDDSNVSRKTPSHDGQGIDDMSAVDGNVTKSTIENNFQKDTPLPFGILCKTFDLIEGTTKRLEINDHLIDLFLPLIESKSFDLATVVHLCLSRLGPVYRSPELGLGETLLMKAIASCTGFSVSCPDTKELLYKECPRSALQLYKECPCSALQFRSVAGGRQHEEEEQDQCQSLNQVHP